MAYYQDLYGDPELRPYLDEIAQEEEKKKRLAGMFQEDRTLKDYVANTPYGQKKFTNIPGAGEDTYLIKEQPLQAPLGMSNEMRNKSPYGVDPYEETKKIAQEQLSQGIEPDVNKIFRNVWGDLNRQAESIEKQNAFDTAVTAKHGFGATRYGDIYSKGTGKVTHKAPLPQPKGLTPKDELALFKLNQLKKEANAQEALSIALGSSPDLQPVADENGNMQNVSGLISEKDYKAANEALKPYGYKLMGTKAVYKDVTWPGVNIKGYQVLGMRRTTTKRAKPQKGKATRLDRETLMSQPSQKRFRDLQQLVTEHEQQGIANEMKRLNPEQYADYGDVFDYPKPPTGTFGGQELFDGSGKSPYNNFMEWLKQQQKKQNIWGQNIGIYGAPE